jgi:UDP-N-acetylmuramyl pentapeptide phosphotransferase/UDP-N-acetylglucosamine-1-phosphate transferase
MDLSVLDIPALFVAILVAVAIATALLYSYRNEDKRRAWIVAGVLIAVLVVLGVLDLARETPRETHIATPFIGGSLPVLGALAMVRATRPVRIWLRWPLVFITALVLLFAGLLLGATTLPRLLAL